MAASKVVLRGPGVCGGVGVSVKNEKMAEIFFPQENNS